MMIACMRALNLWMWLAVMFRWTILELNRIACCYGGAIFHLSIDVLSQFDFLLISYIVRYWTVIFLSYTKNCRTGLDYTAHKFTAPFNPLRLSDAYMRR